MPPQAAPPKLPSFGFTSTTYPSPVLADKVLIEDYDHTRSHFGPRNRYTEIPAYGTEHPDNANFLLVHVELSLPERIYKWYWVNDRASEDTYNYSIDYPEDEYEYPRITRNYLVRRSVYATLDVDTPAEDPVFTGKYLTSQKLLRIEDPVLNSLYVNVERVYEIIPGPQVKGTKYDPLLGTVNITRQAVWEASQSSTLTATQKTTYEAREGSSEVVYKVIENYSDGVSPVFPTLVEDLYDKERGDIQRTTQIVVADGTEEGSLAESGGTITETRYEPYNQFLLKKIVETGNGPYPLFTEDIYDSDRGAIQRTTQLVLAAGSEVGSDAESGGTITSIKYSPYNQYLLRKEISTSAVPGPTKIQHLIDSETQTPVTVTTILVAKPASPPTQSAGTMVEYKPVTDTYGFQITSTLTGYASVTRTERANINFSFPRLVFSVDTDSIEGRDGTVIAIVDWYPTLSGNRDAFNGVTQMDTVVTYGAYGALSPPALEYAPVLNNLIYDGVFWNANERGVLNDALVIGPFNTSSSNPRWGLVAEAARTFDASTPTASQYDALIDTKVVVAVDVKPWKYNLWRMEVQKVLLR